MGLHAQLGQMFASFFETVAGRYLVARFGQTYPGQAVTRVKMLDLVLWQTRPPTNQVRSVAEGTRISDEAEGPTTESHDGPTPNGGVRSTAYFSDDTGHPCPKQRATQAEIIEYDVAGHVVMRTYGRLGPALG